MNYHKLHIIDGLGTMFSEGTILWRTINDYVHFDKTKQNSYVCRLQLNEDGWEPTIVSSRYRGIIVFVTDKPPNNWTHLVVEKISIGLDSPGMFVPGSAIFAKTPSHYFDWNGYVNFRNDIYNYYNYALDNNHSFEEIINECVKMWPNDYQSSDKRLLCQQILNDRAYIYNYCHLLIT